MAQYFEIFQRISFLVDIFALMQTSLWTQATGKAKFEVEAVFYGYMSDVHIS